MSGIRYDASKLQDVIKDFCVITGVSVSVLDDEFEVLASYSEQMPAFCLAIQSTPDGKEKCLCSDMALLKRCRESGKAQSHICHAGVMDAALPDWQGRRHHRLYPHRADACSRLFRNRAAAFVAVGRPVCLGRNSTNSCDLQ